jgi:hypothetical protein
MSGARNVRCQLVVVVVAMVAGLGFSGPQWVTDPAAAGSDSPWSTPRPLPEAAEYQTGDLGAQLSLAAGELDEDGTPDLLVARSLANGSLFSLWRGNTDAVFPGRPEAKLRLKAEETIYELFTWSDGEFRFIDDKLPDYEMIPLAISVSKLILEGLERLYEWDRIQQLITSLQAVPVSVCDLLEDGVKLDEGDRSILAAVNDDRSIEEICLHSHSSEYRVCSLLSGLVEEKKLKLVRPRLVVSAASPVATSADDLATQAKTCFDEVELESALRFTQAAASLEPDNRTVEAEVNRIKTEFRQTFATAGISAKAVPHLEVAEEQLTTLSLSPQEGFILSRINGSMTVSAIVKISPMPELEANLMIWKLLNSELIGL